MKMRAKVEPVKWSLNLFVHFDSHPVIESDRYKHIIVLDAEAKVSSN